MDLSALVRRCTEAMAEEAWRHRTTIRVELADRLRPLMADEILIEQVLLNLLRNSLQALSASGAPDREIHIRAHPRGDGTVQVTVQDTGPPLDLQTVEHLWDPCFTTNKEGLGLGLSISRAIILAHGGCLWTEAGDHPTFHFTLPVTGQ